MSYKESTIKLSTSVRTPLYQWNTALGRCFPSHCLFRGNGEEGFHWEPEKHTGETKRSLKTRISDHINYTLVRADELNGITAHVYKLRMDWESARVQMTVPEKAIRSHAPPSVLDTLWFFVHAYELTVPVLVFLLFALKKARAAGWKSITIVI